MSRQIVLGLVVAALVVALGAIPADAASISGKVTVNNHNALAVVGAVPYDTLTMQTAPERAVVTRTDALGRFRLDAPDGPYLLVAWDGRNGDVLISPAGEVAMTMKSQTRSTYTLAACPISKSCAHLFGNVYWVYAWNSCGYSSHYLSWGC